MRKNKGFTLIELLVVIVIIGILAVLIFLALQKAQQGARDAQRKAWLRDVATAEAMYYDGEKTYGQMSGLTSKGLIDPNKQVPCPTGSTSTTCTPGDWRVWGIAVNQNPPCSDSTPLGKSNYCVAARMEKDQSKGFRCTESGCEDITIP